MASARHIVDGGRGGSIILIGSTAGVKMEPFMIHYVVSKHAVTGMARGFAADWAGTASASTACIPGR